MKKVFIISAIRTPIGSFGGKLSGFTAVDLGAITMKGAIEKAGMPPETIQEVFMGNVISSNLGQAPVRQASLKAGLPSGVPCTLINKVCASGMKAMIIGAQSILAGVNDVVLCGGMESMSNIPYYIPKARYGYKYGNGEIVDGLLKDGLWDPYHQFPMGNCADHTAKEMNISREEQDDYAIRSYQRAHEATTSGYFKSEIIPIEIPQKKSVPVVMEEDEEFRNVQFDKIRQLKPVFSPDGSATAANSSTINDGASALVLASEEAVNRLGLKPIAVLIGFADAAQEPLWFTTSPSLAIPKALKMAGISASGVDYYEINEAFSVVALANIKSLNLNPERVNIFGGAVSLGHPIGCSGARISTTLINILHIKGGRYGVAGICNGGGGASAIVIEKI